MHPKRTYKNEVMKFSRFALLSIIISSSLISCFKDEPLNAECDIEKAWVHSDNPDETFFNPTDTLITVAYRVNEIKFEVKPQSDLTAMAPIFQITEGATIEPASGSVHDFSNGPVTYTVTSEDGKWSRTYSVSFEKRKSEVHVSEIKFDFENYKIDDDFGKFYVWYDTDDNGKETYLWATGNPGFRFAFPMEKDPTKYPTVPLEDGFDGHGVKLETRSTGMFGIMNKKRIAAGNLFYGFFDTQYVLTEPMKSTNFGRPFDKKPIKLTGYYQYTPGEKYQDKDGNFIEQTDQGAIYSVLYRNHDEAGNAVMLYGDDVLTSRYVVAVARMADVTATDGWTQFELDYAYGSDIDTELLGNFGYNLAIVFSSSYEGDKFEGAIGSTLLIDKVRVVCEQPE